MENSRNKQILSVQVHAILRSVIKSHGISVHPTQDMNHPFVQHTRAVYAQYLEAIWVIRPGIEVHVFK